jgi:hypothetical protein
MPDSHDPVTSAIGLVLDPVALGAFWAPALDYASAGEFGSYVALFPNGRPGPKLLLQRVAEPKAAKNRMHLDIEAPTSRTKPPASPTLGEVAATAAPHQHLEQPDGSLRRTA